MSVFHQTRDFKQKTRMEATSFPLRKNALFLPAEHMKDVLLAEENGMLLKTSSTVIAVERDKHVAKVLSKTLIETGWAERSRLHVGDLSTLKINSNLDYAWLDLTGCITEETGKWINLELSDSLVPNSVVVLTHAYGWRNTPFLKKVWAETKNKKQYTDFEHDERIWDKLIAFPSYLMCCLLRDWNIEIIGSPYNYSDRTVERDACEMMFCRFVVRSRCLSPVFPNIFGDVSTPLVNVDVVAPVLESTPLEKGSVMSNLSASTVIDAIVNASSPQHRSHATRKLNAYVAQRVAQGYKESQVRAAIKAHVTRRLAKLAI